MSDNEHGISISSRECRYFRITSTKGAPRWCFARVDGRLLVVDDQKFKGDEGYELAELPIPAEWGGHCTWFDYETLCEKGVEAFCVVRLGKDGDA